MCGIAGYSLSSESRIDRTLAGQVLLAGIAERGADATGYAWRAGSGDVAVHKQRSGASALLEQMRVPRDATQLLVHVRDYTKGHPRIEANNHPIRHGAVVGIHNGVIANDEEIFAAHGFERDCPEMTVDSEAIFALAEHADGSAHAFEQLRGSMATAWLDERRADVLFVARGAGRPLWIGRSRHELFFASTRQALRLVEDTLRVALTPREVDEGTLLACDGGHVAWQERFRPDRSHPETELPPVRSPHEGISSLKRLAAIVAAAA